MTNKEAIEQLKWVKKRICDITYSPESFEALELAIKALERPHVEYPKTDSHKAYWDNVGRVDMRGEENFTSISTGYSTFSAEEAENEVD